MAQTIQSRRDTSANWTSVNPILAQGEIGLETDTMKLKWGNGTSHWVAIPYFTGSGWSGQVTKGTSIIDFGSTPGTNIVTKTISNPNALADSKIEVFMSGDSTATHNVPEHQLVPIKFTVNNIVGGVSFDITALSEWRLDGTFSVNYLIT